MLSLPLIRRHLRTHTLGQQIEYFRSLASTNTTAWEINGHECANGTVILTDHQTAGKGRGQHVWVATPGKSLTFSVILKPATDIQTTGWYSILTGVAVAKALEGLDLSVGLKWPNDIVWEGKKLGGILCESKIRERKIQAIVLGIGLNVNESKADFSTTAQATAASLFTLSNQIQAREVILGKILNRLEEKLDQFYQYGPEPIQASWLRYCSHFNKIIAFSRAGKTLRGTFTGLGLNGEANLDIEGEVVQFNAGEISTVYIA